MDIGVEISLYPLKADFVPAIREFLDRLSATARVRVVTNSMSTQVFGAYDEVMEALRRELRTTFETLANASDKAVFVMKVLGPLPPA
jgi:uncharacterized protein YqgV (UPF0045/DUF77 family)